MNWSNCSKYDTCEDDKKEILTYCDVCCSHKPTKKRTEMKDKIARRIHGLMKTGLPIAWLWKWEDEIESTRDLFRQKATHLLAIFCKEIEGIGDEALLTPTEGKDVYEKWHDTRRAWFESRKDEPIPGTLESWIAKAQRDKYRQTLLDNIRGRNEKGIS